MRTPKGKKYCSSEAELFQYKLGLKFISCPHCGRVGFLNGHGFLRGYAEFGQELVVRGRRFFCSNRYRRQGCGRTFSVLLADVLFGFMVRARTLWRFFQMVSNGLSRRAAWIRAGGSFSEQSGYRLWRRLGKAQTPIRARLCRERSPPFSDTPDPLFQLLDHLRCVFPASSCPFSSFQSRFQTPLLG